MRIKLTILLILFFSIQIFGQNESAKKEKIRVQNKIREKSTFEFDLQTNDSILIDQDFYNNKGQHIKDLRFNEEGEIRYSFLIEYNSNGQKENKLDMNLEKFQPFLLLTTMRMII